MKKAAIYNPYLDTLGGGERYTLTFAKVLAENGYIVDLEWKDKNIINSLSKRFGMSLSSINVVKDIKKGDGYDLCFWVSDGSVPLMHARNNILHFQIPFHNVNGKSLMNKMKLIRINKVVCNSEFTKNMIDKEFGIKSIVIAPPVDINIFRSKRKENIILYVGRFSKILQSKGQDVLISCFKKIFDSGIDGWKLVLAGGNEIGAEAYIKELKDISAGYPIDIIESPSIDQLKDLYGKSKIFWSAAGFGSSESENPEKMEHWGITVVEAMSAGCVPIIFDGGGYKEIVRDNIEGYLWKTEEELITKTKELMENNKQLHNFELSSKRRAGDFSQDVFEKNIVSYILQNTK